jgi:hypothetical protein
MTTRPRAIPFRALLLVGAAVGGWFALLDLLEVVETPFFTADANEFRGLANNLSRSAVTLISTVCGCLFFAVPFAANMYTPQIIETFWRGRTHRAVIGLYVFSAANALWLTSLPARDGAIPQVHLAASFALVTASLVLLPPYLFALFRLLDPESVVARVGADVVTAMAPAKRPRGAPSADVAGGGGASEAVETLDRTSATGRHALTTAEPAVGADDAAEERAQSRLERRINELGAVMLRTLERGEREFAIDAVGMLVAAAKEWSRLKPFHAPSFFAVDSRRLHGASPAAIRMIGVERLWVDLTLLRQLGRAFSSALMRAPDVVGAVARGLRHYAVNAAEARDEPAVRLAIRFLNNFMRDAVARLDDHAIYDLLFQAGEMGAQIWKRHGALVVVAVRRLDLYGRRAAAAGRPFAHALVAYDVGRILVSAEEKSAHYADLLTAFLTIGAHPDRAGEAPHRLFVKARAVTAARLAASGRERAGEAVFVSLRDVAPEVLRGAVDEVLGISDPWFWEVTDRQENVDWLPPSARAWLTERAARVGAE